MNKTCSTCNGTGIEWSGVCHCGESMDDPNIFAHDNHSPVEMQLACPDCTKALEDENAELRKRVGELKNDKLRLDWMEEFIQTGVIETAFEMDGGIHLTLSTIGDHEEKAYREQNSLREAIDAALASGKTEGEKG